MQLRIDGECLKIELDWWRKLLAVHFRSLEIPLASIERVETERVRTHWGEVRMPGSYIPGLVKAGTFRRQGRRDFWCVAGRQPVIRLSLRGEYFHSVTLGLADNERWAEAINRRLAVQH